MSSYSVPASREGAICGTGGVVTADGRLFVIVGNGASANGGRPGRTAFLGTRGAAPAVGQR